MQGLKDRINRSSQYTGLVLVILVSILTLITSSDTNLLLRVFVLTQSILLFITYINNNRRFSVLVFVLLIVGVLASLKYGFNKTLFVPTLLEQDTIIRRGELFAGEFGKIYKNRLGLMYFNQLRPTLMRYVNGSFSFMDFNLLFNTQKIVSILLLLPFGLGLIQIIKNFNRTLIVYFMAVLIINGFLIPRSIYGVYLLLPLINLCITIGLIKLYKLSKHD